MIFNKLKKHSVTKICSDLSLFGYIVLVISKTFSRSLEQFFLIVGQNNFDNKITNFQIFSITNGFTDVIGQGGYATVFKGTTNRRKLELAIKKLKVGATDEDRDAMERQLNYEVDQFERYQFFLSTL